MEGWKVKMIMVYIQSSSEIKIPTRMDPMGKVLGKAPNLKSIFSMIPEIYRGAEGETRTRTTVKSPPPQDGVSTSSTTSASDVFILIWCIAVNKIDALFCISSRCCRRSTLGRRGSWCRGWCGLLRHGSWCRGRCDLLRHDA
jgi:hypothetical protein